MLCTIAGVSRQGYYKWAKLRKQPSVRRKYNEDIKGHIVSIHLKRPIYGVPRMVVALREVGYQLNHKRIYRLMRELKISSVIRKKRRYFGKQVSVVFPNRLNRDFRATVPNQKLVTDITYSTPSCQRATTQQGVRHISMFGMQRSQCLRWGPALLPLREGVSRSSGDCRTLAR